MPEARDRERGKILSRAATIIEREQEWFAQLHTLDSGKSIREWRLDVEECAAVLDYYAGLADKLDGSIPPAGANGMTCVLLQSVGVVAPTLCSTDPSIRSSTPRGAGTAELIPDSMFIELEVCESRCVSGVLADRGRPRPRGRRSGLTAASRPWTGLRAARLTSRAGSPNILG